MSESPEITKSHPLKPGRQSQSNLAFACALVAGLLGLPAVAADGSSSLADSLQHVWKEATTSVQFGGFVSQGFLANTGHNDYLGDTSRGTFDFREYAVNASYAIGQWRFGMQVFGQKLGPYGDDRLEIDWATVDYQPAQWFGLRAGRVKMPRGLYNEALDVDSVRPFVLLPQSVYDARLRDFNAAFDGGMIFGNVGLKKFGSLDYRVFYGDIPIAADSGASDYFNNDYPSRSLNMKMDSVRGGSIFWNTPRTGLRFGYSYSAFQNLRSTREASVPFAPPPAPEIEVVGTKSTDSYGRHLFSIEYATGPWVFAAEAGREHAIYHVTGNGLHIADTDFTSYSFYVSVARRINRWLELGTYYSYSRDTETLIGTTPVPLGKGPALTQADLALSARFDITRNLIFKLEGHYMDGAGKIFDTVEHPQPVADRDMAWFLFAAKVTYSF
ncbi:hypothetical protein CfE428DRAFT_2987 [Chthoniobacter flavus Ellin428]|uniref:Phosphate-selective porin O and P n=1 Tax=Chthoniobacter flavus Ellin428 TaxID=497964 RepID=B4D262_9BACT|nr:hypothetical protein CfE428DRAFT_2987 [Chthoniobacter flavus Ellin428]TCO90566.1 hypothetical protein EV701_110190 [Chthoniobacter flavus]